MDIFVVILVILALWLLFGNLVALSQGVIWTIVGILAIIALIVYIYNHRRV